jgi:hypothetical protein
VKAFSVNSDGRFSRRRLEAEAKKMQGLSANCQRKLHHDERQQETG